MRRILKGQDTDDLCALPLKSVALLDLAPQAIAIALDWNITAYDASYVALAQVLSIPLITADERLVRALSNATYDVQLLGGSAIS